MVVVVKVRDFFLYTTVHYQWGTMISDPYEGLHSYFVHFLDY